MASFTILRPNENENVSDDEEESYQEFVPFSDRPEWSGVQPTPQDDGEHSVVAIQYTPAFAETFAYFRTILKSKEISNRAFELTTECIRFNPSNYTVWHYRRVLIAQLDCDLLKELVFIQDTINDNQKNYQVWEHYKCIITSVKSQIEEKKIEFDLPTLVMKVKSFIHEIINDDSKNYHAWQHLQWMIEEWAEWKGELEYTQALIDADIRNNSAWNHRFFVLERTTKLDSATVQAECTMVLAKIELAPRNESAWNYLTGLFKRGEHDFDVCPEVIERCKQLYEGKTSRSSYLMAFMVDYFCQKMEHLKKSDERDGDKYLQYFTETIDLLTDLETSVDTIRGQYWKYRANVIRDTFGIKNV